MTRRNRREAGNRGVAASPSSGRNTGHGRVDGEEATSHETEWCSRAAAKDFQPTQSRDAFSASLVVHEQLRVGKTAPGLVRFMRVVYPNESYSGLSMGDWVKGEMGVPKVIDMRVV